MSNNGTLLTRGAGRWRPQGLLRDAPASPLPLPASCFFHASLHSPSSPPDPKHDNI